MSNKQTTPQNEEQQTAERLRAIARLQLALSRIDKIRKLRGDLPTEVENIENELAGIDAKLSNLSTEAKGVSQSVKDERAKIGQAKELIERYEAQLDKVRNNREYDNLSKEIEFQKLEITLSEKTILENNAKLEKYKADIEKLKEHKELRSEDLKAKQSELGEIVKDTQKEEEELLIKAHQLEEQIDYPRLLEAFHRIRNGARNGLAVVPIERDACGGCFNRIPPQHQLEIRLSKKITVCEYCGRIIIAPELMESVQNEE